MAPQSSQTLNESTKPSDRPIRVLVVDHGPHLLRLLKQENHTRPLQVLHAPSLASARNLLAKSPIDLALIESELSDGSGLDLAHEVSCSRRIMQAIVVSEPSLDVAVEAIRVGAADYIARPFDYGQLRERINKVLCKQKHQQQQQRRVRRLRRLCKKLNEARLEVTEQVDILCQDLVLAYQELACQMQQIVHTSEYGVLVRDELDLESLLRKTLEYLIDRSGPTNAAIFLPSSLDEYSLGGYVNYDCTSDSADMLLQHLADVLAPKLAESKEPLILTNNKQLREWLGDDKTYLNNSNLVATSCQHEDESLAVLVLFRDQAEPFDPTLGETLRAVSSMLGEVLARIIRVHHRHLPDPWPEDIGEHNRPF